MMWKVKPNELATLSQEDRGLLFNYFGALGRPEMHNREALIGSVIGCVTVAFTFVIDSALQDLPDLPGWFATLQLIARITCIAMTVFWVVRRLHLAKSARIELADLSAELRRRELDVSGVTQDQVFESIVLPMLRRSGIKIKEE